MSSDAPHDCLIETSNARVWRWTLAKGQSTGHHRHEHDYVVVPITGGALQVIDADGESTMQQAAGEPYARSAGVEHEVVGADSSNVVFVEIEILTS